MSQKDNVEQIINNCKINNCKIGNGKNNCCKMNRCKFENCKTDNSNYEVDNINCKNDNADCKTNDTNYKKENKISKYDDNYKKCDESYSQDYKNDNQNNKILSIVSHFKNLNTHKNQLIQGAVLYFWKSHNDIENDKHEIQAAADLIHKYFDLSTCEKYEVSTGYLSRYNFLKTPISKALKSDINQAIKEGINFQNKWNKTCGGYAGELGFVDMYWEDCIDDEKNPYFSQAKTYLMQLLDQDIKFKNEFIKTVDYYAEKHDTNTENGYEYIKEEIAWILSLNELHKNKKVYLIHVGNSNPAIDATFEKFQNLKKNIIWLSPYSKKVEYNSTVDFLLHYRNQRQVGYSFAVENGYSFASKNKAKCIDDEEYNDEYLQSLDKNSLIKIIKQQKLKISKIKYEKLFLSTIIQKLPGHVYWLDTEQKYLGCNENQAKSYKLPSPEEIVGKTNYDLLPFDEAKNHYYINKKIIDHKKTYFIEENATMSNCKGCYLSQKTPLMSSDGKHVIGILGVSIDITSKKNAEKFKSQNKLQKVKIQEQEKFRLVIEQLAHDMMSPIATLAIITESCKDISDGQKAAINNSIASIKSISEDLLQRYNDNDVKKDEQFLLFVFLHEILRQKKYQYKKTQIKFEYEFDKRCNFSLVDGDKFIFMRMMSNLINNAVEAYENEKTDEEDKSNYQEAIVSVKSSYVVVDDKPYVKIIVQDFANGMPSGVVESILNYKSITYGKKGGHGVGFLQINSAIEKFKAKLSIDSVQGSGTTISIQIPIIQSPDYIAQEIIVRPGNTVVIVDDEQSIHDLLRIMFKNMPVSLVHFKDAQKAVDFIADFKEKSSILLLSDYEFRDQNINGAQVIEQVNGVRAIIITNNYHEVVAQNLCVKIIPKSVINNVKVVVSGDDMAGKDSVSCEKKDAGSLWKSAVRGDVECNVKFENCKKNCCFENNDNFVKDNENMKCSNWKDYDEKSGDEKSGDEKSCDEKSAGDKNFDDKCCDENLNDDGKILCNKNIVLIDDNQMLVESFAEYLRSENYNNIDIYTDPHDFLENVKKYDYNTKIVVDKNLNSNICGMELVRNLKKSGYNSLYLLTGTQDIDEIEGVNILLKGDMEALKKQLL